MSSGPGSWFFFSSRHFQSCVVDKLGHVTHHQLAKTLTDNVQVFVSITIYMHCTVYLLSVHTRNC